MTNETAFSMDTSSIKYGPGVTREVGYEMHRLGARRVMVLTDPRMAQSEATSVTMDSLRAEGVDVVLYDRVRVEPTDVSFKQAIDFATDGAFDGFVAVGGGSSMDTAKAANLYSTYPADFFTYINAPIGKGEPVPGPLRPLIAIPTTTGTGSETTGVAIFDLLEMKAKTGISPPLAEAGHGHRRSRQRAGPALDGDGVQRLRRAESRAGVIYRHAIRGARGAGEPRPAPFLSGLEPDQRRMGFEGHRDGRREHAPRRPRP